MPCSCVVVTSPYAFERGDERNFRFGTTADISFYIHIYIYIYVRVFLFVGFFYGFFKFFLDRFCDERTMTESERRNRHAAGWEDGKDVCLHMRFVNKCVHHATVDLGIAFIAAPLSCEPFEHVATLASGVPM
jgi:hypothetical protein